MNCSLINKWLLIWVISFPMVLLPPSSGFSSNESQKIAIIVNSSFPAKELTLSEIKDIYLGNKKFIGWTKLYPFHQQRDRILKTLFIETALDLSPVSYMGYWHIKSFRDGSSPPKSQDSPEDMIESVRATSGGLGYIWANEIQGLEGIHVLFTLKIKTDGEFQ